MHNHLGESYERAIYHCGTLVATVTTWPTYCSLPALCYGSM